MLRRLMRHFARGLVENDLISPGEDLHASIAGVLSVFVVVSAAVTLTFLAKYNSVSLKPNNHFHPAQFQTLADKLSMALDDKALLIGGAMLIMSLLVVLWWDALVLDERDASVLAPLPLRPSIVIGAKAAVAFAMAAGLAAALNILPALLFPIVVLLRTAVGPLTMLREMGAHAAAGAAGCIFAFLVFSCLRGLAALSGGNSAVNRMLPALQFAFVLGLLALLFTLPELSGATRNGVALRSNWIFYVPWLWFVGLCEVLAGRDAATLVALARIAVRALVVSSLTALAIHGLTLRLRFHRTGVSAISPESTLQRLAGWMIARTGSALMHDGRARASFFFTVRTITRHPRHRLYVAASLGVGVAVASATIAAAYGAAQIGARGLSLTSMGLAAQLNLIFFLVVGLRMTATIPADVDAGWTFRFAATPARERHLAGTRAAIFIALILPLLIVLAPVHVWLWGWYTGTVHFAFGAAAALLLLEVVFTDYRRMPFVSSFVPGRTVLTARFGLYVFDYFLFAYLTPSIEQLLIERTGLFFAWLALIGAAIARLVHAQSKRWQRDEVPVFDHGEADLQALPLWDTVHGRKSDTSVATFDSRTPDMFGSFGAVPRVSVERAFRMVVKTRATFEISRIPVEFALAIRRIGASPGFALFSVLTLALGIGATTALYSVIYSTILRPLPVRDLNGLVNVYHSDPKRGSRPLVSMSLPDYLDFAREQHVFSVTAAHAPFGQVVVAGGVGEPTRGELVSGRYFETLGLQPLAGRLLQPADDVAGAAYVTVIAETLWRNRFAAASDIVGRRVFLAGHEFVIVGVAPAGFHGVELPNLAPTAMWIPLSAANAIGSGDTAADREFRWLGVKGRLASGRTLAHAQAELQVIAARLDTAYPIGVDLAPQFRSPPSITRRWVGLPAADRLITERDDPSMRRLARITMIAVGLVLLVACTNLSNLALARGARRRQEIAIKLALGASRAAIVREHLVEHAVVTLAAAVTVFVALRLFVSYGLDLTLRMGPWTLIDAQPTIDSNTLVAGIVATLLSLVVAGLLPAISLTRGASLMGTASVPPERWQGRRTLIASQVAVSVALVAIASLCARHIVLTASRDTGLDLNRLAYARFDFRVQGWTQDRAERTLQRLMEQAAAQPGIESTAIAAGLPWRGSWGGRSAGLTRLDRPFKNAGDYGTAVTLVAGSPSLLRTLGLRVVSGRGLMATDTVAAPRIVILNQFAALRLFGTTDVVGRQVLRRAQGSVGTTEHLEALTVVGVAEDTRDQGGEPVAAAYVPLTQHYFPSLTALARTRNDPSSAANTLGAVARRIEPELGIIDAGPAARLVANEALAFQVMGALAGVLGMSAMALAMIGLYGVLSYIVAQRTREIGIRVALGATTARITRLIVGEGLRPVIEGIVVGFVMADLAEMAMRPALQTPLPAIDASVLVLVPLPFLVAAAIACYLPSRRAAAVNPTIALRHF